MGIFEAVGRGFSRSIQLVHVLLIFFVFNVIVGFVTLPLANPARAGRPGVLAISILSSVLFFLVFIFLQGGALGLIRDNIKTGSSSIANFVEYGKKFYLRILGLLLVYILIAVVVVLVLSLVSAAILLLGDNVITRTIVAVLVTVVALIAVTLLVYPIYVLVIDGVGPIVAFKKGYNISRSNFWKTIALFLVVILISVLISIVVGAIVGLITVPLPVGVGQVLITLANAIVQSYLPIVMMVALMSYYMSLGSSTSSAE